MKSVVALRFVSRRYGRTAAKFVELRYDSWDEHVMRWLWPALLLYEGDLRLEPQHLTTWDLLVRGLPGLSEVKSWRLFSEQPIESLEFEQLRDFYIDVDRTFHTIWGPNIGAQRSSAVRRFLKQYLNSCRPDGVLARANLAFVPLSRDSWKPRPLISDGMEVVDGVPVDVPIGALAHKNPGDLKANITERLRRDLQRISEACAKELDAYEHASAVVDQIFRHNRLDRGRLICEQIPVKDPIPFVRGLSTSDRIALIAHYSATERKTAGANLVGMLGAAVLGPELSALMAIEPLELRRCLRYRYYPHSTVIVAAMVILQIRTAWNISSVAALKRGSVRALPDGSFVIQSVKSRTGDDTPMVIVASDEICGRALRVMLQRCVALEERGWISANDQCMWTGAHTAYRKDKGEPLSNPAKALATIRKRYGLPHFTFEMLRTQALTCVSLEQGPIVAAETAGHSTFNTIGRYIDHLVLRRTNSAISLQFQKKWEAEVLASLEDPQDCAQLMPVGDGSSCAHPSSPPEDTWLAGGLCSGEHCHDGGGCPNRRLVIDQERIQEAILVRRYYARNWERLLAENRDSFARVHQPRLEFNIHLLEYLKRGPYRHLVYD